MQDWVFRLGLKLFTHIVLLWIVSSLEHYPPLNRVSGNKSILKLKSNLSQFQFLKAIVVWRNIHRNTKFVIDGLARTIMAMGCRQCLPLRVVQLKSKQCRKPHYCNGVADTFWLGIYNCKKTQLETSKPMLQLISNKTKNMSKEARYKWYGKTDFFREKPKPSLKIRTASAIFWIYLGRFRDYDLKSIFSKV